MSERDLFMAILQIEGAAERSAYLDRECGGDTALRQRVEALLAAFEQAGSFLQGNRSDLCEDHPESHTRNAHCWLLVAMTAQTGAEIVAEMANSV